MHDDVKELCKYCDKCQHTNNVLQKPRSKLHPIPVSKVWDRVGIDLVGPLPETKCGNKYIVTLSDYFSKWPEAAPLKSKCAEGVADFLFDVFCRHGWPKIIQSDQGREFINAVNSYLFKSTNIQHCISSAYHPQTNGLDERFSGNGSYEVIYTSLVDLLTFQPQLFDGSITNSGNAISAIFLWIHLYCFCFSRAIHLPASEGLKLESI